MPGVEPLILIRRQLTACDLGLHSVLLMLKEKLKIANFDLAK